MKHHIQFVACATACALLCTACGSFSVRGENGEMERSMESTGAKDFADTERVIARYDKDTGVTVPAVAGSVFARYGLPTDGVVEVSIERVREVKSPTASIVETVGQTAVGLAGATANKF